MRKLQKILFAVLSVLLIIASCSWADSYDTGRSGINAALSLEETFTEKHITIESKDSTTELRSAALINYTFANGTQGTYYSDYVTISGGTAPYTWSIASGSLPTGLRLTYYSTRATVSGTPTAAGTYSFTLRARDANGNVATKSCSITINQPVSILTTFKNGTRGTSYFDDVTVSGGSSPYTWTLASGALPTGLRLSYSGTRATISGTPTVGGTYSFTLRVRDTNGSTAAKSFSITITPFINIPTTFKNGTRGTSYSDYVTVSGGSSPYTWTIASGSLPTGVRLSYSGTRATISGTPTTAGTYNFTLRVRDTNGSTVTKNFNIIIVDTLTINYAFKNGTRGTPYSDFVAVNGGTAPYTWTLASGSLPTGLRLTYSGATATVSGTPTAAGTYSFTLRVRDTNGSTATKNFNITIGDTLTISGTFNSGSVGTTYYSGYVTVRGGTAPYTWSVSSGALPAGLRLTYSGTRATVSGTPTGYGNSSFTLQVRDSYGNTATKSFSIYFPNPNPFPAISGTFKNGTRNTSYLSVVTVSNGTSPYTWSVSSGALPAGLRLAYSGTIASISGTPTVSGTYNFTLQVRDSEASTATKSFSITINSPVSILGTFKNGDRRASYSDYVTVSGGTAPYTWSIASGSLPSGLRLTYSGTRATISGTPTGLGTSTFTLRVRDTNGSTATKSLSIKITDGPTISGTFSNATRGTYYSKYVTVNDGIAPYTWSIISGSLPTGLRLTYSGTRATISGTPTVSGTSTFWIRVADTKGRTATKSCSITINQPVSILAAFKNSTRGTYYSDYVLVSGGTAPYTWTIASGSLPAGLRLTYSGTRAIISGIPTLSGTYSFTLRVRDANGSTAARSFSIYSSSYDSLQNVSYAPDGYAFFLTGLNVDDEDVIHAGDGRDNDIITVRAHQPVKFILGEWVAPDGEAAEVDNVSVFIDDEAANDITVEDDGTFTLPTERVQNDFRVYVKAQSEAGELSSEELYILPEE